MNLEALDIGILGPAFCAAYGCSPHTCRSVSRYRAHGIVFIDLAMAQIAAMA